MPGLASHDAAALDLETAPSVTPAAWHRTERFQLALRCFFAAFVVYAQRTSLALAIVRMQSKLGWSRHIQGLVLAAFFGGYMVSQLPSGWLAARFGARRCVGLALLVSSLISLALPVCATASPAAVVVARVVQGLAQGVVFPGMAALWANWSPPLERSRLQGSGQTGGYAGAMVCNVLAGAQCDWPSLPLLGGWQGVFVLWGLVGAGCSAYWWATVGDTPEQCARCSAAERAFISERLAAERDRAQRQHSSTSSTAPGSDTGGDTGGAPAEPLSARRLYGHIVCSAPCWAIALAHTAYDCASYTLEDGMPAFLRDVLGFELATIGVLLAIPGALRPPLLLCAAALADRMIRRRGAGRVRKGFTVAALVPQALFLLGVGAALLRAPAAIVSLLAVVVPLSTIALGGGYAANHLDIAPTVASFVRSETRTPNWIHAV